MQLRNGSILWISTLPSDSNIIAIVEYCGESVLENKNNNSKQTQQGRVSLNSHYCFTNVSGLGEVNCPGCFVYLKHVFY